MKLCRYREECEARQRVQRRNRAWDELIRSRGVPIVPVALRRLYRRTTQKSVGGRTRRSESRITTRPEFPMARNGRNLVLYGPKGTGKDHILIAVLRHAISKDLPSFGFAGCSCSTKNYGTTRTRTLEPIFSRVPTSSG